MKMKNLNIFVWGFVFLLFGDSLLLAQRDVSNEILVYFVNGVDRAELNIERTKRYGVVKSIDIKSVLSKYRIKDDTIESAFPNFEERDTLIMNPFGKEIKQMNRAKLYKIACDDAVSRDLIIKELLELPNVLFAEPNGLSAPSVEPNDTYYGNQWGLNNGTTNFDIHAEDAWDIYTGNSDNLIAIIDGGVDNTHPDLVGKVSGDAGWAWGGHGIHVAGIAGALSNNSSGVSGVDWNTNLYSQKKSY